MAFRLDTWKAAFFFLAVIICIAAAPGITRIVHKVLLFSMADESLLNETTIAKANKAELLVSRQYRKSDIVLLGDSLIELFEAAEFMNNARFINRGVRGDTLQGVKIRMEPIIESDAGAIVVLVGVNDLLSGRSIDEVTADADDLVTSLCTSKPTYVLSVLPTNRTKFRREVFSRSPDVWPVATSDVVAINLTIAESSKNCPTVQYVNLWPKFVDMNGDLYSEDTVDGLHLSSSGMVKLADILGGLDFPAMQGSTEK